jgi:hypothetical protein
VWAQFSQRSTCPPSAEVPAGLDRRHDGMINLSRLCRKVEENLVAFSQVRTKDFCRGNDSLFTGKSFPALANYFPAPILREFVRNTLKIRAFSPAIFAKMARK